MALDTAQKVAALRSLTAKFDNAVSAAQPFYPTVSTTVPSDGADEEYGLLGSMPGVREWLGDRQFNQLRAAHFTIRNRKWESSLAIEKDRIADDRLGIYGLTMSQLGVEAAYHPDELFFEVLLAGEAQPCFDGQFFFDTDHVWGESGSQSNDLTSDVTDPDAVTVAEFKTAYHAARQAMVKFKRDNGKLLNRPTVGRMSELMLLVPPELREVAETAVRAIIIDNTTNILLDAPTVVESAHLTNARKFYLFNNSGMLRPFVFQAREPLTRQMKGSDDIEFKDVKFMTQARYNVGYLGWWTAVLTTFT